MAGCDCGKAIETVHEVHGVDHRDHHKDRHDRGQPRGTHRQAHHGKGHQHHAEAGEDQSRDDLPAQFGPPVDIPEIVRHSEHNNPRRRSENPDYLPVLGEHFRKEGDLPGEQDRHHEARQHGESAEPRNRRGVHIPSAHGRDGVNVARGVPRHRRRDEGDGGGDQHHQRVCPHSGATSLICSSVITP